MTRTVAIDVYEPDNSTYIGELPHWNNLQWLDDYNDDGSASITLPIDTPDKFWEVDNVYHVRLTNEDVFAFSVDDYTTNSVDEDGNRQISITGMTLWGWLDDICIYPEYGLDREAPDERPFGFQSKNIFRIFPNIEDEPTQWRRPYVIKRQGDDQVNGQDWKVGYPEQWPDPDAYWVWGEEPESEDDSVHVVTFTPGFTYMRRKFETTEAGREVSLFAATDEYMTVWIDGRELIETSEIYGWQRTERVDTILDAGEHHIAIKAETIERAGNPSSAGILLVLADAEAANTWEDEMSEWDETGSQPQIADADILLKTDSTNPLWYTLPRPDPEPGWYPSGVLAAPIHEARARGDDAGETSVAHLLQMTFQTEMDSHNIEWTEPITISATCHRDTYRDLVARVVETDADFYIEPNGDMVLLNERGSDLSDNVIFTETNVEQASIESEGSGASSILGRYSDGYFEEKVTPFRGIRREKPLSLGNTDSDAQARKEARFGLEQVEGGLKNISVTIPESNDMAYLPKRDFDVADIVSIDIPEYRSETIKVRSIAGNVDNDGNLVWEVELGETTQN